MSSTDAEIDAMSQTELAAYLHREMSRARMQVYAKPKDEFLVPTETNMCVMTFDWKAVTESLKDHKLILMECDDMTYTARLYFHTGQATICLPLTDVDVNSPMVRCVVQFASDRLVNLTWIPHFHPVLESVFGEASPRLPATVTGKNVSPRDIAKYISNPQNTLCSMCHIYVRRFHTMSSCNHTLCVDCERGMITQTRTNKCVKCRDALREEYKKPSAAKRLKLADETGLPLDGPFNGDEAKGTVGSGDCPVCLETYVDAYMARCGHTLCRTCWVEAAGNTDTAPCPTCRASCSLFNMIRNFAA